MSDARTWWGKRRPTTQSIKAEVLRRARKGRAWHVLSAESALPRLPPEVMARFRDTRLGHRNAPPEQVESGSTLA